MTDHILIFSDHRGCQRFALRLRGTAAEIQLWLERWSHRSMLNTNWTTITWADS
ncbi:MAG: hypothetical protein JOZ31_05265 [Verrucomicrobia bacterium]|nr:hypothetical protein [Verrucomicrobiota bacterium]